MVGDTSHADLSDEVSMWEKRIAELAEEKRPPGTKRQP